jgi:hypothetical protein
MMYSVEELDQLSKEMQTEAVDSLGQWYTERDIAEFEDLCKFWHGSTIVLKTVLLLRASGAPLEVVRQIVAYLDASYSIGVQFGYEIAKRQEISRSASVK